MQLVNWHALQPGTTYPFAPLAQSVERLHGKEKVDSSILSGSSVPPLVGVLGDVAQLVRALDS
jgi:hypothetical protein